MTDDVYQVYDVLMRAAIILSVIAQDKTSNEFKKKLSYCVTKYMTYTCFSLEHFANENMQFIQQKQQMRQILMP